MIVPIFGVELFTRCDGISKIISGKYVASVVRVFDTCNHFYVCQISRFYTAFANTNFIVISN